MSTNVFGIHIVSILPLWQHIVIERANKDLHIHDRADNGPQSSSPEPVSNIQSQKMLQN
jgi:hypothetical protein